MRMSAAHPPGPTLPIAYPHVLAMPLHLAMLGAEAFPVRLFGLVHVQNRIAMRQPLSAEEPAEIRAWIEGHRDTERGQEFDLHTEYVVAGEPLWDETCTFLARRKPPAGCRQAGVARRRGRTGCGRHQVFAASVLPPGSAAVTASSPAT